MDRNGNGAALAAKSRAEQFEDEKRRIIESCFNKTDPDGSLQETYITHIRITEYSTHPSNPPPPYSRTPEVEKPRIIIVAVRKSGRVRMHKSKENSNGTFSIGKTWNLDDLSHIQSYTGPTVDANLRQWAGDTGFLVTIQKPYFWNAQTDKEKKFFIASLVKIYGKYTNGKTPELSGFDPRELDQVLGRRPPPVRMPPSENTAQRNASGGPRTPVMPPQPSPTMSRSAFPTTGKSSPAGSFDSSRSQNQAALRRLAGSDRSQDSLVNNNSNSSFNAPPPRGDEASPRPPRSRGGMAGPGAYGRFGDPSPEPAALLPTERPPPERRRPPIDLGRPQQFADRDLVPAPLMSPGMKRDPVVPPPRSTDRMSPRNNSMSQRSDTSSLRERSFSSQKEPPRREDTAGSLKSPSQSSFLRTSQNVEPPVRSESPAPLEPEETRPGLNPMTKPRRANPEPTPTPPPPPPEEPSETRPGLGPMIKPRRVNTEPTSPGEQEESRPGLGPMIKAKRSKGDIAGSLWKAAAVAGAFKPRPGGAGERLRLAQNKSDDGPDGITSVVPAPPRPAPPPEPVPAEPEHPKPPKSEDRRTPSVPEVKVTVPQSSRPNSLQSSVKDNRQSIEEKTPPKADQQPAQEEERRAILAGNDAKYLATLGVDPTQIPGLLENPKSVQLREWMDVAGFVPGDQMRSCTWDKMKSDLDRELDKAQAGGWLSRFKDEDERIDAIKEGIDQVIAECEQLDDLLTLYSAGLGTITGDIDYLEAQAEGIQVQVANQKALQNELRMLTDTCALDRDWNVEPLRRAPLEKVNGLADIEESLLRLYKTMRKIDPSLCGYDGKDKSGGMGSDLGALADDLELAAALGLDADPTSGLTSSYGRMRIVQEKKEVCLQESNIFINRFLRQMETEFDVAFASTRNMLERALSRKSDKEIYQTHRRYLWKYCSLTLYARDIHLDGWETLLQKYHEQGNPLFRPFFGGIIESWKGYAKKATGEEAELLFTHQPEKQHEGLATAARKLTVKRSQTLAGRFRSDAVKNIVADKSTDNKSQSYEVFRNVLDDIIPLVEMEHNFVVDFFHATTLEQISFEDYLAANPPVQDRKAPDHEWLGFRRMEPDREMARRVTKTMEGMFSFLEGDLQKLVDWVVFNNPLHAIGVLASLEIKAESLSGSNQEFLNALLQKIRSALEARFRKFVDEQVRAIEETKVKMVKKRRGVIHFFRVFPHFAVAVENIMAAFQSGAIDVRHMVNEEYSRVLKAMFDALKVIARESKGVGVSASTNDPEDKEALNYHILLIENLSYFIEEMGDHDVDVLADRKHEALQEYNKHLDQYLSSIMRRPLGKLLDYLENVEAQLQALKAPDKIALQPSNSKSVFNKVLSVYDAKEVRKGIEALRKRVEKHFGEADEPGVGGGKELVDKVTEECEKYYGKVELRIATITAEVYGGDVLFEWPRAEVRSAFAAR